MIRDLILKNRSYRRYYEERNIGTVILKELVDLARLSPNGKNIQALRYMIFNDRNINEIIFKNLFWAGYLKDWNGPRKGERPSAYIIMLKDTKLMDTGSEDEGIASQSILLGAVEKKLGGCIIRHINRKELRTSLNISDRYEIKLVIALGYPKEEVVIEEIGQEDDIKYYRDENFIHHVPKRRLEDVLLRINDDYEIVKANPNDKDKVITVINKTTKDLLSRKINQWEYPCNENEIEDDIKNGNLYVLKLNGTIIGTFGLKSIIEYFGINIDTSKTLYLYRIALDPDYQGRKIGAKIITFCKKYCSSNNKNIYLDCWSGNKALRNFYSSQGMEYAGDFKEKDYSVSVFKL